jgi:hypothetical protein
MSLIIEGKALAAGFGCKFIETSAKNRTNVDEAFYGLVREIRRFNKVYSSIIDINFRLLHLQVEKARMEGDINSKRKVLPTVAVAA